MTYWSIYFVRNTRYALNNNSEKTLTNTHFNV